MTPLRSSSPIAGPGTPARRPRPRLRRRPRLRTGPRTLLTLGAVAVLAFGVAQVPAAQGAFLAAVTNTTNSAATAQYFHCADVWAPDAANAVFQYRLDEASGSTTAADSSGAGQAGTYQGSMVSSTASPLACSRDPGGAYVLDGSTSGVTTPTKVTAPTTFTEECWFRTTIAAGKMVGFGSAQTGSSGQYDRQLYFSGSGQVRFGTYYNGFQILTSPGVYTDGKWHQAVATMSAQTGSSLYVDGVLVDANATYTDAQASTGWWRIGYDNIGGWVNNGVSDYFTGSMRYVAVYSVALTAQQAANHWAAGQPTP